MQPYSSDDADSADDLKGRDRHLKAAQQAGDATHREARDAVKSRWRHPRRSTDWSRDVKECFATLPED
ncbi:MAG: hypothetical protein ABIW80_11860 [Lapillicoccus sp.]